MSVVLGIYIDSKLIKYVKIKKENDDIKILNFNIEFYENLSQALRKIIYDTNSQKIPISINLSEEFYTNFTLKKSANKKEIKRSVQAMVQMICDEKKEDIKDIDYRFIVNKSLETEDDYEILLINAKKENLKTIKSKITPYKIKSITPIGTSIKNLINENENKNKDENYAIVNIEETTKVTSIIDGNVYKVNEIKIGIKDIIKAIDLSENLYQKNYNIYKNMTIYTKGSKKVDDENYEYLECVLPVLYKIVIEVKKIVDDPYMNISKIYITGSGANINNLDLYFNEYILNIETEILKPYFLEFASIKTSIKEYLEVTSAMAIALDGLENIDKNLNFYKKAVSNVKQIESANNVNKKESINDTEENETKEVKENIEKNIKVESDEKNLEEKNNYKNYKNKEKENSKLTSKEKLLLRICATFIILIVGFLGTSNMSNNILEERKKELAEVNLKVEEEVSKLDKQYEMIEKKTEEYRKMTENLDSLINKESVEIKERIVPKDSIPKLLENVRKVIPEKVNIISISNETNSKNISIQAVSEKYEQLGYFSSILKTENVLLNVKTSSGVKEGENIKVLIEGELP